MTSPSTNCTQVNPEHYSESSYDTFERWSSYWHQIEAIRSAQPKTLLEIGVGTGLMTWYMRHRLGIDVTTCDFDPKLQPDVVADIRTLTHSLPEKKFNAAVAFQVLEHLPFSEFPKCIEQLSQVARDTVVISLPHTGWRWGLSVRVRSRVWKFGKTIAKRRKSWSFEEDGDGQHYWEIGVQDATLNRVLEICSSFTTVSKYYFVPENPYHCFIVMRTKNSK